MCDAYGCNALGLLCVVRGALGTARAFACAGVVLVFDEALGASGVVGVPLGGRDHLCAFVLAGCIGSALWASRA